LVLIFARNAAAQGGLMFFHGREPFGSVINVNVPENLNYSLGAGKSKTRTDSFAVQCRVGGGLKAEKLAGKSFVSIVLTPPGPGRPHKSGKSRRMIV
jgi:hypothetical protein